MFYLGMYEEAQKMIEDLPESQLKIRLLFHLAHKLGDDDRLMELHGVLRDVIEDQLSLAGLHYLRGQYQEAIDIYKRILLDNKQMLAVNVYVALCYYKLDYFGMSQEVLDLYLASYPDSTIAANLKACNRFRMFNGQAAEQDIKHLLDTGVFGIDLIRHNLVVFRNGEGALQVLPELLDIIPEARLNLAIHHLKRNEVQEAHQMIKDIQPKVPHEYILKGVVHASMFQQTGLKDHAKQAQQYLHLVGGSATECDTIPGRQAMASSFFLYGQFEEVLVYLNSIRSFFINDDTFNFNYAQAKVATGYYKEAEELLMQIHSMHIRNDHTFSMILARCHINCGHADQAWNIFVTKDTTPEAFSLLQLIANDCYRIGEFWIAAKAFDMLEKMDPSPEHWDGKRGACAGALYNLITKKKTGTPQNGIGEIISLLRETSNSQAEAMLRAFRRYASTLK
jgi:intraflagellar transport protein 56